MAQQFEGWFRPRGAPPKPVSEGYVRHRYQDLTWRIDTDQGLLAAQRARPRRDLVREQDLQSRIDSNRGLLDALREGAIHDGLANVVRELDEASAYAPSPISPEPCA